MLSIALIGVGRIGHVHARHIAAHPRARLVAVYDSNAAAAAEAAEAFNTQSVADAQTAINAADALLIASATATHCDYLECAAVAGRPALCEKPPDIDIARVNVCRDALAACGEPLVQIGFNRRFDPGHAALQVRTAHGEIGKLEKLIITSRDPAPPPEDYLAVSGGLFRDMMIHDFDLARFILREEPVGVFAAGAALVAPDVCARTGDVDTAMVVMQTASGVLCHINCSRRAVYGHDQRVEVFGEKGMLISNNCMATQVAHYDAQHTDARTPFHEFFTERYADAYHRQLDAFIESVENAASPSPSFEDGRRALLLAEAAEQSMNSGRWAAVNFDQT